MGTFYLTRDLMLGLWLVPWVSRRVRRSCCETRPARSASWHPSAAQVKPPDPLRSSTPTTDLLPHRMLLLLHTLLSQKPSLSCAVPPPLRRRVLGLPPRHLGCRRHALLLHLRQAALRSGRYAAHPALRSLSVRHLAIQSSCVTYPLTDRLSHALSRCLAARPAAIEALFDQIQTAEPDYPEETPMSPPLRELLQACLLKDAKARWGLDRIK